uniref:Uncharacterized protein n=1 Tax=Nelumbo nucifera TaxID=4432 RepID=A0A822YHB4_NELNU|nr:TPA_asm: hypothetical protein HUJ06_010374 [Nelumbo nucifera]
MSLKKGVFFGQSSWYLKSDHGAELFIVQRAFQGNRKTLSSVMSIVCVIQDAQDTKTFIYS